jgi:SHOCT-like domain
MSENRKQILEMLAEGKITSEEAERLIAALDGGPNEVATRRDGAPKYIRVLVEAEEEGAGDELTKVNIRVPIRLLRAGVKLAGLIPQEARSHVNEALREKGMAFDINQLKPENLDELIDNLQDLSIDVDKKNRLVKVKVFCE